MLERKPLDRSRRDSDDENQDDTPGRRKHIIRSFEMSDDEWAARVERRDRFRAQRKLDGKDPGKTKELSSNVSGIDAVQGGIVAENKTLELPPRQLASTPKLRERKPWESLVIGNVGENLSHIERKDREIEQQMYIVQFHEEHSPHQVEHNKRILSRLMRERHQMEDNEENNMPQDQREERERICKRLEALRWALGTSQCEDEKINIRTAIQGYESGQIPYSLDFTLIYAGFIVDTCPSYRSFCEDRTARLDRYFAEYGPGWLWQEPPLAGPGYEALGMKGICIDRNFAHDKFRIGSYQIHLEFTIQRNKVSKGKSKTYALHPGKGEQKRLQSGDASCQLETLLDSGATFPIILNHDLARLNIDLTTYPAQGVMQLQVVGGTSTFRFYEMHVSVCSNEGKSLVGEGEQAVWPDEPRTLGGFYPVLAQAGPEKEAASYIHRLSGLVPFDACYLSSAPNMERIWVGEDRRDVLGASRLPAHLRFDTDKKITLDFPREFEKLRQATRTPDRVIFLHKFPDNPQIIFTDSDALGIRGRSELAIGQYQTAKGSQGAKAIPQRVIQVEPRKGGITAMPKKRPRPWKSDFDKHA
ncbi:hypothetical protein F5Y19DRAFT_491967 [Xylariaceae sp. FL1651]|nr:hypothetical protein F5Y19DRAFT_491967 [Xylariaceae sp. FL1651]